MGKKLTYLDFKEAYEKIFTIVDGIKTTQNLPLLEALGKVVSKDIKCIKNLPSFNNSAMDGFAIKWEDRGKTLKINKTIFAGQKGKDVKECLNESECYKIMTGAIVPNDVDTIVPIENCLDVTISNVTIPENIKKGANLRLKGEEKKEDEILIKKGEIVTPNAITLLASQGISVIEVFKGLNIVVLSTGDELKEPWQKANEDEIYNCNSYALIALLKQNGFNATYGGVVSDSLEKTKGYISELKKYDVIITTGGVSLGDADFVAQAFAENGLQTAFHGVNVKPGRPIMVGKMEDTLVASLPGNPLTAMVNAQVFLLPILKKFQSNNCYYYDVIVATNTKAFCVKKGRTNIVLGNYENGKFIVTKENKYGSGSIVSLYESNCIVLTDENTSEIKEGDNIKVVTFNGNFCNRKINILN